MSVTLRFQSTGSVPGNARPVTMHGPSLTIGRGQDNDLVLPDPDRMVSKTHCVIENHGGSIFVVDLSTNGTFLNYSKVPLGRSPTAVNDGDVLSLGPYEIVVQIGSMADDLLPPVDVGPASHGRASAAPDPLQLLDDAPPGMDFLDSLLGDPKGPKGPGKLKMGQFDPDALLPPLDEDEPLLGPQKGSPVGPAMQDHSPAVSDAFRAPEASRSVIPDDWEDDLMPVRPAAANPFAPPPSPFGGAPAPVVPASPVAQIPDDLDDLLGPLTPDVAPAPDAAGTGSSGTGSPFGGPASGVPSPSRPRAEPVPVAPEPVVPVAPEEDPGEDYPPPIIAPIDSDVSTLPPLPGSPPMEEDDDLLGAIGASGAADDLDPPAPVVAAQPVVNAPPRQPRPGPLTASAPMASDPTGAEAAAVRAFMEALGASDVRLSEDELIVTMGRLGATLREMITGLREILMTRSSIKSEFRIDQTMITSGKNNPLKFSISADLAVEAMTKATVKGYLPADEAARQALDDIKAHEIGMVTGMEAALKGVLSRLDPAELTGKIESKGGLGSMFRGKKALYWETYEKMYAEIADQAENDFHDLFAREFAQAYKDQLARLKQGK